MKFAAFALVASNNAEVYSNASSAVYTTDEDAAEQRKNFDIVVKARAEGAGENSYCSNDMRSKMPGCHQSGHMWCWATAVAATSEYYGTSGHFGDQCKGLECEVVTWTFKSSGDNCCPFKSGSDACGRKGAFFRDIERAMNHFTKKTWTSTNGPLDKATLDATLQAGNPVTMGIGPGGSATHVVTLHGCGSGKYWYHDPERNYGEFINVDYDWLLNQCVAWQHNGGNAILIPCVSGSAKGPDEIFRIEDKWYQTLHLPASVALV